jgi:hypothetical protein
MSKGHSKGKRVQRDAEVVLAGWRGYDEQDDADIDKIEAYIEHLRDKVAYQRRRAQQLEAELGITRDPETGNQTGGPKLPPVPPAERSAVNRAGFSLRDMASDLRQQGTSAAYEQLDGMIDKALGAQRQGRVIMPPGPYGGGPSFVPPYGGGPFDRHEAALDTLSRSRLGTWPPVKAR